MRRRCSPTRQLLQWFLWTNQLGVQSRHDFQPHAHVAIHDPVPGKLTTLRVH